MITLPNQITQNPLQEISNLSKPQPRILSKVRPAFKHKASVLATPAKKNKRTGFKSALIKRLSPFILITPVIIIFFCYDLITGKGIIHNNLLILILFPFTITNVLFTDFALWNYFRAKRKFVIWAIELLLILIASYFIFRQ